MQKKQILLFFGNAIGDAFMTMPTIRAFFDKFEMISLLCEEDNAYLFIEFEFQHVYFAEIHPDCSSVKVSVEALNEIKETNFDIFVSLTTFHNTDLERIMKLVNAKINIGLENRLLDVFGNPASGIFNFIGRSQVEKRNMFDVHFKTIKYFYRSLDISDYVKPVSFNQKSLLHLSLPKDIYILAIHTDTKIEKTWPARKFYLLINKILTYYKNILACIIGKPKFDFTVISDRVLQIPDSTIVNSVQLLNNSDFFIGLDSCFMHLADVNNIPSLILYGPTDESEWGFRFNKNNKIIKAKNEKITSIPVREVYKEFKKLVNEIS
jgi:ADP-heptose:LPS heptosyltransferase